MSRQRFTMFAIAAAVVLLLLPFGSVAVWDGHFPLPIVIDTAPPIDASELYFATCWRESEAQHALETGPTGEISFRPGDSKNGVLHTILVPCSGRAGPYSIDYSHHEPLFLVVQYSILEDDDKLTRRKWINIPTGRGPRSINATVP